VKKIFIPLMLLVIFISILNLDTITLQFESILGLKQAIHYEITNKIDDFYYVQKTNDFIPLSKGDLKNIFYTLISNGNDTFTFYCPKEYELCFEDVKTLTQDQETLTHINNFIHPYYNFSEIKTTIYESGEVNVTVSYLYTEKMILEIEDYVNDYLKKNITNEMDLYEKIKTIHDYIINNTKYDVERNEKGDSKYQSYLAYGAIFEGYATCNGYTDIMAIFLSKLEIKNYKIATDMTIDEILVGHVWNAVYVDSKWLHLDLTWDDPVASDGKDYLQHHYFLIDDEQLIEVDSGEVNINEHNYPRHIYLEFKKAT